MKLTVRLVAALLLAASPAAAAPPASDFEITQAVLDRLTAEALPAVQEHTGVDLSDVVVRTGTREEVADLLTRENLPLMTAQVGEDEAEARAREFAVQTARLLLAKSAFGRAEILVLPERFRTIGEELGQPDFAAEEVLQAVLVHELVHAADDARHDLLGSLVELGGDTDRIRAYNALIEGHAQHAARRICAELGWSEGFERFTASIGAEPPGLADRGEGARLLNRMLTAAIASAYVDGEAFVASLVAEAGPEVLDRVFGEPPADMRVVHNPRWYLHPEERPAVTTDLDAGLDRFARAFPEEDWSTLRTAVDDAQLAGALSILPDDVVRRIRDALVQNRVAVFQPEGGADTLVTAVLYEWSSETEGDYFQAAVEELQRTKDETMSEGDIRIASSEYEALEDGALAGERADKVVVAFGVEVRMTTVIATEGRLTLELLYQGEAEPPEALLETVRETLGAARPVIAPEEPVGAEAGGQ